MGVKLRIARPQPRDEPAHIILVHAPVLQEAKDGRSMFDAEPAQNPPRARREQTEKQSMADAVEKMAGRQTQVQPEEIACQTKARDAPVTRVVHQNAEHDRVQVKVEMAVDVVEREAGRAEFPELDLDFAFQLRTQVFAEKVAQTRARRMVAEISFGIDQPGNFARC